MQISELARRAQLTTRQVRHYEREGLITGRRGDNGYRDYPPRPRPWPGASATWSTSGSPRARSAPSSTASPSP
ncbi:MerR family DNA-binding transcriptional regulator [Phenylobacterium sp. J426]|uniref:MerR family DNA-binding transcriptional regulator n=1 Tax=Phenylobacterium sp. J426 TaxID=2898439 RepID=UPI0035ADA881